METENMNPEDIFHKAIEIVDSTERAAYLDEACKGNEKLRAEVEELLKAHEQAGDFLEADAVAPGATLDSSPSFEGLGTKIGHYELLQLIGEGGMGLVYLAQQKHPVRREGALKIIKPGMDSKEVIARFDAERQTLAVLDHPNIARVFDAGTTQTGRPYFVMEYVKGLPITQYCDEHKLNIEQRLKLFKEVCEGVHYAHQKGIIHRDIKPSNILVSVHGDRVVPKIIDFGIAKATASAMTEKTLFTYQGQLLGTPEYMSPEQVDLAIQDVDTRSDIYSLGVVLYELLAGVLPFERASLQKLGFAELQQTIRDQEPATPSHKLSSLGEQAKTIAASRMTQVVPLTRRLHRELEWIPLKAMRKDRCRRYKSAAEMADDIQNYLNGSPLIAGPETATYRVQKFVRKHAGSVATVALVAAAIVIGLVVSIVMYFRAEEARNKEATAREQAEKAQQQEVVERKRAEKAEVIALQRAEDYRKSLYFNQITLAATAQKEGDVQRTRNLLESCPDDLRGWEWTRLNYTLDESEITLYGTHGSIYAFSVNRDGTRAAATNWDGTISLWDITSKKEVRLLPGHGFSGRAMAFSPDGRYLASGGMDQTVRVWEVESGNEVMNLRGHADTIQSIEYANNGTRIYSGDESGIIRIWDAQTGKEIRTFRAYPVYVLALASNPDDTLLASSSMGKKELKLWDVTTGLEFMNIDHSMALAFDIEFSPDGRQLVTAGDDGNIRLWDSTTGKLETIISAHSDSAYSVSYSPEGDMIVSSGDDGTVRVYETRNGKELTVLNGHEGSVRSARFLGNSDKIISSCEDGTIKIWDMIIDGKTFAISEPMQDFWSIAFSPDGRYLASGEHEIIRIWDRNNGIEQNCLVGHIDNVVSVVFSPDGQRLYSGNDDKTIRIWNVNTGEELKVIQAHEDWVSSIALSPDGKYLVSVGGDLMIHFWDANTGAQLSSIKGGNWSMSCVCFSPCGKYIATTGAGNPIRIWDVESKHEVRNFGLGDMFIAFSPDGRFLVSAGGESIRLWNFASGELIYERSGHSQGVTCMTFNNDGSRFVSTSWDGLAKIWDTQTGTEVLSFNNLGEDIFGAAFSPDGETLAISSDMRITLLEITDPSVGIESRRYVHRAKELVNELYEKNNSYNDILQAIMSNQAVHQRVQEIALKIAASRRRSEARKLGQEALEIVLKSNDAESAYRNALSKVERALSFNRADNVVQLALGIAKYRLGLYQEALAVLVDVENRQTPSEAKLHPALKIFKVMALVQLGQRENTMKNITELRGLLKQEQYANDQDLRLQLIEMEKLLVKENERVSLLWDNIQNKAFDEALALLEEIRTSEDASSTNLDGAVQWLARECYNHGARVMCMGPDEYREKIDFYKKALSANPSHLEANYQLAWLRIFCPVKFLRDSNEAILLTEKICDLTEWGQHRFIAALAAAYSERGDFELALKWQDKAIEQMPEDIEAVEIARYEECKYLYQNRIPYHKGRLWSFSDGELVARWTFDDVEDDLIKDSSGHDLDGKLVGDAHLVSDPERDMVLALDGNGDYLDCGTNSAFDISGAITLTCWIKQDQREGGRYCIFGKGSRPWMLGKRSIGSIAFRCSVILYNGSIDWHSTLFGANERIDDKWHHIVGTYDGREMRFYYDGALYSAKRAWGQLSTERYPVYIGEDPTYRGCYYRGLIDDVRIYSYALSAEEVKMLYEGKEPPREKRSE